MKISVYRSPDERLRTEKYASGDGESFSIAERLLSGTLVTDFKGTGEVINQQYVHMGDVREALSKHLGEAASLEFIETQTYEPIKVDATCTNCGTDTVERELDRQDTRTVHKVPVVPIFVCRKCGTKFYSMTDAYLKRLIENNASLFEAEELKQRKEDDAKFVNELQEYIIRIFASKRIHKLNFRG